VPYFLTVVIVVLQTMPASPGEEQSPLAAGQEQHNPSGPCGSEGLRACSSGARPGQAPLRG